MENEAHVFLSYSQRDEKKVADLYQSLFREGYRPWMDVKDTLPGENRRLAIDRAMRSADFFIACLSANSVNERGFVQSQFRSGLETLKDKLETDIYLIPVRFEDCDVPDDFKDLQMADLFTDEGQAQLLMALKVGLERRRGVSGSDALKSLRSEHDIAHTRQPTKVELATWEEKERNDETGVGLGLGTAANNLPLILESAHFIVHFGFLNPSVGQALSVDGVRDRVLVRSYLDALERCYEVMTSPPWSREPPIVGPKGKTAVFILDSSSFTATDLQMVPFICLPNRNDEPTSERELARAAAEAVHEAVHLFNCRERPFHDAHSGTWEWYDCGLATFIESIVLPDNLDYLRFVDAWIRLPEKSLEDTYARHYGFIFVQYLANRLGLDFVNEVWTTSFQNERPAETMARMLSGSQAFASHESSVQDIFGSGYCVDSFFYGDPSSACYMPQAYIRYGHRAVAQSLLVDCAESTIRDRIDHLGCKYYRLYAREKTRTSRVQIYFKASLKAAPLKVEVVSVGSHGNRVSQAPLRRVTNDTECEQLLSNVSLLSQNDDHLLLVVSNCGLKSSQIEADHDDDQEFEIVVSTID